MGIFAATLTDAVCFCVGFSASFAITSLFCKQYRKGQTTVNNLKVDTVLTGVCKLRLDRDGTLSLQLPLDSSQYFLSKMDIDILQREHNNTATWWKVLAVASVLAGSAVLWAGLRYNYRLRVQWEQEQERMLAEAARQHPNEAPLNEENSSTENVCVICLSQPRNCILLNCGHICCCYMCFQELLLRICPICRQNIVRVLPVYQP